MSLEQAQAVGAAMLARRGVVVPLDARRAGFEARAAQEPLPEGVTFTHTGDGIRVATPDAPRDRCILWVHGGAFVLGSPMSWRAFGARLALGSGWPVLLADYPLAPEHRFPAALDHVAALIDRLGSSHRMLVAGGDSAGANLVAAAAQRIGGHSPDGVILLSPYLDLTHSGASVAARGPRDPFVDTATMPATAATYLGDADPADPRASPLFGDLTAFPPTLVQVGSEEALFDDAARFADRLRREGCDVAFQEWIGMLHCWPLFAAQIDEGGWAIAQMGNWVRALSHAVAKPE